MLNGGLHFQLVKGAAALKNGMHTYDRLVLQITVTILTMQITSAKILISDITSLANPVVWLHLSVSLYGTGCTQAYHAMCVAFDQ